MKRFFAVIAVLSAAAITACGPKNPSASGGGATAARRDRSVMDSTELRSGNFTTVYDAISALHADWLLPRGGPSGGQVPSLGVFIDGQQRNRGVDYLRTIRPVDVKQIRRLSTTESLGTYSWPFGGLVLTVRY